MSQTLLTRISALILVGYAALLLAFTGPSNGWPGSGATVKDTTDYVAIWTGGRQALEGRAIEAYDWSAHKAEATKLLGSEPPGFLPWPYPPIFLAVAALFALLPYGASMMAWVAATWAFYSYAAARIMGAARGALWMSVSVAVLYNAHVGQNGALSAGLLGLGLLFVPTRPVLAGVLLGLMAYKPHLGLLIPIALAAAGQWRAFLSAAVTVVVLAVASGLAFGFETWPAFVAQLGKMSAHIAGVPNPEKLQSLYGLLRTVGVPNPFAFGLQAVLATGLALLVWHAWRREGAFEAKAALLASAALLTSPYVFVYDLAVLMVAQAFLLRSVVEGRFDEREVDGIVVANALIALYPALGLPSGLAASLILLALSMRRLGLLDSLPGTGRVAPAGTEAAE